VGARNDGQVIGRGGYDGHMTEGRSGVEVEMMMRGADPVMRHRHNDDA